MVIGRFTGDRLVDRIGVVQATRWPAVLGAVTLVAAVASRSYPVCVLGFFLAGTGTAILFPMGMVAAGRDSADPPRTIAAAASVGYLGWVLAPGLIGGVAAVASLPLAVGTAALFLALAAGLGGTLRPRSAHVR
jgi:fucose permease